MPHPNQIQYIRPRCPRCKKLPARHSARGFNLRYERAGRKARITCKDCHYSWLSTNRIALAEVGADEE